MYLKISVNYFATDTQTQKSISGYRVLLEGAPVMSKSSTQSVALSVCEAEQTAGILCAQDMIGLEFFRINGTKGFCPTATHSFS